MSGQLSQVKTFIGKIRREKELQGLTDAQLLYAFGVERDEESFRELVTRHGALVWTVCHRILGNASDADDASQATFMVLAQRAIDKWQHAPGGWLRPHRFLIRQPCLAGWLCITARHIALRAREKKAKHEKHEKEAATMAATDSSQSDFSESVTILYEELDRLPERHRVPVILHWLEGKPIDVAAEQLGLPRRTFERYKARGIEILRARLSRRGFDLSVALSAAALAQQAAEAKTTPLMARSTAHAAITFATGSGGGALSTAAALAKAFLANSTQAKWKGLLLLLLTMGGLATGGILSADRPTPEGPPPPIALAEPLLPRRIVDLDAEQSVRLKTLVPRIIRELEHMAFLSKAECLVAEVKEGKAEVVASWQLFRAMGVKNKSLIRLIYDLQHHEMGVYFDFAGSGRQYAPVDPAKGAWTRFGGKDYSLFGQDGLHTIHVIFTDLEPKPSR